MTFRCEADYIEACDDLKRLQSLRALYEHVRARELELADVAVLEGAAIPDAISSVDTAIRDLKKVIGDFDAEYEWFHGQAIKTGRAA